MKIDRKTRKSHEKVISLKKFCDTFCDIKLCFLKKGALNQKDVVNDFIFMILKFGIFKGNQGYFDLSPEIIFEKSIFTDNFFSNVKYRSVAIVSVIDHQNRSSINSDIAL